MFCSNCGEKCNDDMNFCPKCGKKISKPEEPKSEPKIVTSEKKDLLEEKVVTNTTDFRRDEAKVRAYRIRVPKTCFSAVVGSLVTIIVGAALIVFSGIGRIKIREYFSSKGLGGAGAVNFFGIIAGIFGLLILIYGILYLFFPSIFINCEMFAKQAKKIKYGMEINLVRAILDGYNIESEGNYNNGYLIIYHVKASRGKDFEKLHCVFDSEGILIDTSHEYHRTRVVTTYY